MSIDRPDSPRPQGNGKGSPGLLDRIVDYSGRRRFLVFLVSGALVAWGLWAANNAPLDALPDLSETQVIIATEWMGRSPTLIEDQITYPLSTGFLGTAGVRNVRGQSMFGMSFVYVIFEDGTDLYWARSRVVEQLARVQADLPPDVTPEIGPDATALGWVYQYALVDCSGKHSLQDLRSFQDFYLRFWLESVQGVAEVASVGGFQKQYQIQVDPVRLEAYGLSIGDIAAAVRGANVEVGGRVVELAQHEYAVRGRGYVLDPRDLELAVVTTDAQGTPIRIEDVAVVTVGGDERRGVVDLDGRGEVVGGIVTMRMGENALRVIERVQQQLEDVADALPPGVEVVSVYDRSRLIRESVQTLSRNLILILAITILVIALLLLHVRSAMVSAIALPAATAATFLAFYYLDVTVNIMSLAGVILALGDMVDSTIVMVENAHKRVAEAEASERPLARQEVVIGAARELGPHLFGVLLVLTVGFLPVFALEGEEGRLFFPLALAKTVSMVFAALFAVTLVPALMVTLLRGPIRPPERSPVARLLTRSLRPLLAAALRFRWWVAAAALAIVLLTYLPFAALGSEFMPPLYEGDLLYMPVSIPPMPISEARRVLSWQDARMKEVPEVDTVFGKAGRAATALDPAPLSMFETTIRLKPRRAWRPGVDIDAIIAELDEKVALPGLQPAWTMPIRARLDMLTTGIRTPVGIKVMGPDLEVISEINAELERVLAELPGTRSAFAERELGGLFLDVTPNREQIARYGLTVRQVLDVVEGAIGGMDVDTTIEGRERYSVNVRYPRELRQDLEALRDVRVPIAPLRPRAVVPTGGAGADLANAAEPRAMSGAMADGDDMGRDARASAPRQAYVPLGQVAHIEPVSGPPMAKSELGSPTGWVYVDLDTDDVGGYVQRAREAIARQVELPRGYRLVWTGQYEFLERVRARLSWIVPVTLGIIFVILYLNFRGIPQTLIVMTAVPFAAVGSIWSLFFAGFNTSVAVWVGIIALLGVAAETASIMVIYLDEAWEAGRREGRITSREALVQVTLEAGSARLRPILMTVLTNLFALIPILVEVGPGADVARRIALPMWGGIISLALLTVFVVPALYVIWRGRHLA